MLVIKGEDRKDKIVQGRGAVWIPSLLLLRCIIHFCTDSNVCWISPLSFFATTGSVEAGPVKLACNVPSWKASIFSARFALLPQNFSLNEKMNFNLKKNGRKQCVRGPLHGVHQLGEGIHLKIRLFLLVQRVLDFHLNANGSHVVLHLNSLVVLLQQEGGIRTFDLEKELATSFSSQGTVADRVRETSEREANQFLEGFDGFSRLVDFARSVHNNPNVLLIKCLEGFFGLVIDPCNSIT